MAAVFAAATMACVWAASVPQAAGKPVSPLKSSVPTPPRVTIALLPTETDPQDLGEIPELSVGVMSAGLSKVSAAQTYFDISQGNRVFTSLYDDELPVLLQFGNQVPRWDEIVERADSAPAEIVPGLLGATLREGRVQASADALLVTPAVIAADRRGRVTRVPMLGCSYRLCPAFNVVPATIGLLPKLIEQLQGEDLLIAMERPPPPSKEALAIGIAGEGFGDGNLTSDTTRTDGFVIATDIAPTVLDRYEIGIPDEMSGRPIRAEGEDDAAGVAERAKRMRVTAGRRSPVILDNLMIWTALALLAALFTRGRAARPAFGLLGLSVVYLPALLLVGAAVDPSLTAERLIVGLGAPALAALTLYLHRGWDALAIACGVTVGAYAIDMLAGSPLTARSLLGPNPGLGVRFFGIGNELEATMGILIPVGVGAGLTAWAQRAGRVPSIREAAIAFLGIGGFAAALFAAGRFGADVGAAIVFPAGAAVAALAVPGALKRRRLVLLVVAAPVAGLAGLAALDLVLGGDAHLSRSVFEAGGADQVGQVFERRLRLSASSFGRATGQSLFWFSLSAVAVALVFHKRILAWLRDFPFARAGLAGAAAAMLLGIVANDSGALFLTIGTIALLGCLAFAFSQTPAKTQARAAPGTE